MNLTIKFCKISSFSQIYELIVLLLLQIRTLMYRISVRYIEVSDVYPWMNFNQVANLHIRVVSDWQCPITIKPLPNWEAFNSINKMMPNRKVSSTSFAIEFVLSMCVLKLRTFYDRDLWQVMLVPNWFNSYRYFPFSGIRKNWSLLRNWDLYHYISNKTSFLSHRESRTGAPPGRWGVQLLM